jgi:hypothetical protein
MLRKTSSGAEGLLNLRRLLWMSCECEYVRFMQMFDSNVIIQEIALRWYYYVLGNPKERYSENNVCIKSARPS